MRIIVVYRPNSDHGRVVDEYLHEFSVRNPEVAVEAYSIDSREGSHVAELYGVVQYPSMLAVRSDGQMAQTWQGLPLPLMNEVAYFALSQ